MDCDVLILSGLWNSGPTHWQTHMEQKHPAFVRVPHRDYNNPLREEWVNELDAAIAAAEGPPILVAHSLACMLVAHWAQSGSKLKVAAAMLVAPSDVEAPSYPVDVNGFAPIPLAPLGFPSVVVASTSDEYVSVERARQFADAWGSEFKLIRNAGHINGASGYGEWPEGEQILAGLCAKVPQDE